MQRGKRPIGRLQWLVIIIIEVLGCLGVGALTWSIFVSPTPPDFSALLGTPTPSTDTPTATLPPTATFTASPLPALLSTTAAPEVPVITDTPPPNLTGTVIDNGDGLNMRAGPGTEARIVARLLPNTPLTIIARSEDNEWLQVIAATGDEGWVSAPFVVTEGSFDILPVITAEVQTVVLAPTFTPTPIGATPLPTSPTTNGDYPYILGVSQRARDIFLAGQAMGNRPGVFSKIGDSITEKGRPEEDFLSAFGRGGYNLGEYGYLQPAIDFFTSTEARLGNSFVNDSLSAAPGWSSWTAINFHASDDSICAPLEIPIECELRMIKPSVALIMLGTNDVPDTKISANIYESQMRKIIETCINMGVVPVLSTIPEFKRPATGYRVAIFNEIVVRLSDEYQIPLWQYWAAINGLPNNGLSSDGVHPSISPLSPADLSPESMQYGMNVRNLTALQALDAIWREVILD
jgi:hypothetical protein